jgi:hypothetical protein
MEKVLTTASSADATLVAMKLLLRGVIVEELALGAEELAHADTTVFAHLLHILLVLAQWADHPLHTVSVNLVAFPIVLLVNVLMQGNTSQCLAPFLLQFSLTTTITLLAVAQKADLKHTIP